MSHICTHSDERLQPRAQTLELNISSGHPFWDALFSRLMEAERLSPLPAFPHVTLTVQLGGVVQAFQLAAGVDMSYLSEGEEPVASTRWYAVGEADPAP